MRITLLIIAVFVALSLLAAYAHAGLLGLIDTAVAIAFFALLALLLWPMFRRFC